MLLGARRGDPCTSRRRYRTWSGSFRRRSGGPGVRLRRSPSLASILTVKCCTGPHDVRRVVLFLAREHECDEEREHDRASRGGSRGPGAGRSPCGPAASAAENSRAPVSNSTRAMVPSARGPTARSIPPAARPARSPPACSPAPRSCASATARGSTSRPAQSSRGPATRPLTTYGVREENGRSRSESDHAGTELSVWHESAGREPRRDVHFRRPAVLGPVTCPGARS